MQIHCRIQLMEGNREVKRARLGMFWYLHVMMHPITSLKAGMAQA